MFQKVIFSIYVNQISYFFVKLKRERISEEIDKEEFRYPFGTLKKSFNDDKSELSKTLKRKERHKSRNKIRSMTRNPTKKSFQKSHLISICSTKKEHSTSQYKDLEEKKTDLEKNHIRSKILSKANNSSANLKTFSQIYEGRKNR